MIRINLLGTSKPRKTKRPAFELNIGEATGAMVPIVIILALAAGGNYFYYWRLNAAAVREQKNLEDAQAENRRLADVKSKYLERQKQFQLYERRVKVIHELQASQTGPTELLNMVASTVNSTDAVWLVSMNDDGANINLEGSALSANAVANLITNLKKANYFTNVEIKESFQDDGVKDMQAFQFSLVCEKKKA